MVTEERDELRNLVNEFKRSKNDEAGDETVSGAVLQVIYYFSSHASYFIHSISHMVLFVTWFACAGA